MTVVFGRPLWRVVERNAIVSRRTWYVYLAGGVESFLFLFSVGVGVGALIHSVASPSGDLIPYRNFVAPAMLGGAAMNSAIFDSAINFFIRFKYIQTYEAMLATPLTTRDLMRGELAWSMIRVTIYSTVFLGTMLAMGLIESWWALLALPAVLLMALAFGSVGMLASTWMRSWLDFDLVFVATVPLFLFSATFFPLGEYPRALQLPVQVSPLYHGTDLLRRLVLGGVGWAQFVSVAYLVAVAVVGSRVAERRVARLLQP